MRAPAPPCALQAGLTRDPFPVLPAAGLTCLHLQIRPEAINAIIAPMLQKDTGISMVKNTTRAAILAALKTADYDSILDAIASVREPEESAIIYNPADISRMLGPYALKRQEHFIVITMDGAHHVQKIHVVSKGLSNKTIIHPREVFYPAIMDNAQAIIIAHNHPSGRVDPSQEDKDITDRLTKAAEIMGISILDHVIVVRAGYYSFSEHGLLK